MGRVRYLFLYFLVGTVGALAQCFSLPGSMAPMIGASGAVAGVLGGYVMLYPRARIQTFVAIPFLWNSIDVPAWFFLGFWFVSQFFLGAGSGVAWMAHVGGFLAGLGAMDLCSSRVRPITRCHWACVTSNLPIQNPRRMITQSGSASRYLPRR